MVFIQFTNVRLRNCRPHHHPQLGPCQFCIRAARCSRYPILCTYAVATRARLVQDVTGFLAWRSPSTHPRWPLNENKWRCCINRVKGPTRVGDQWHRARRREVQSSAEDIHSSRQIIPRHISTVWVNITLEGQQIIRLKLYTSAEYVRNTMHF